jgi:geranylgeranyl reductase
LKKYDVVIVGAGPSGLRCAWTLGKAGVSSLLLEKNPVVGDKICAGGITRKGYDLLQFPDDIIEHKVDEVGLHSVHYQNSNKLPEPVMFTVDRHVFGQWMLNGLKGLPVEFRNNSKVTEVHENRLTINGTEEIGFNYLVGADGPNSIVRRYLKLPVEKVLATVQYIVPVKNQGPRMEVYLNNRFFHSWYAWSFPHKDSIALGACCDPKYLSGKQLKKNFADWLVKEGYDISKAKYESYPISYDYRGLRFDNIFLSGEAAGIASGLTGEGIYQSLVSGEEVANMILGKPHPSDDFKFILKYNQAQHKFLRLSNNLGKFKGLLADLVILTLRNKWVNKKISKGFS